MTELSFLIDLLLNHDLPKDTKNCLAERIKYVESNLSKSPAPVQTGRPVVPTGPVQAPSTLALLAKHGETAPTSAVVPVIEPAPVPPELIAQTPMAAAALERRQESLAKALAGKADKNGRAPKW